MRTFERGTAIVVAVALGGLFPATPTAVQEAVPPALLEAIAWYTGVAGRVDDDKARSLLEEASGTGHPLARLWVARCLSRGRMGYPRDPAQARAVASAVLGEVERLSADGVLEAVFLMGTVHDEALGVKEDPATAAEWFRRAAERGHVLAQHNLGNAYAAGRGVEKSDERAVEWWLKAAAQGDAIPQLRLGEAYEHGRGVARDLTEARRWYQEAADRGNAAAKARLLFLRSP